ncbi:helix-turn-helix domain-containing protein [Aquipuribacter sp. SD81]|uniref:helix-turn-helix domain-containing protein n=1 Tax=Aquipuribacter sp. SD81 TaxID=3127703 RepID=UPI003017F5EE
MASADLLLHPVRIRVVQALLGGRDLTTAGLRELLPDVAVATLYRHVAALVEGGVLRVVEERPVRGSVERTFGLVAGAASIGPEELRRMTAEEHRAAFLAFSAMLIADFDRYLADGTRDGGSLDPAADRTGYRHAVMHLSDEEVDGLLGELAEVLGRYRELPEAPGRTRRALSTVLLRG